MRAAIVETDSKQTIFRLISSSWFHYGESQAEQLEEDIESCLHSNVSPIVGELNGKGRGREIVWPTGNKRWSTIRFIPKHIWWCSSSFAPISLRFRIPPCCAIDFHRKTKKLLKSPAAFFLLECASSIFAFCVCPKLNKMRAELARFPLWCTPGQIGRSMAIIWVTLAPL